MNLLKKIRSKIGSTRGQGLVEYGILVGGVALVSLAGVSILGHKANDLCACVAAALPCAHEDDISAIVSGKLVATTVQGNGLVLDTTNPGSISSNLGITGVDTLVSEP